MKDMNHWSRRKFIYGLAGTGALAVFNPLLGWTTEPIDPEIAQLVADALSIDTHNHVDVPLDGTPPPDQKEKLGDLMATAGLSAICMTFAVDYQKLTAEGQAYDRFINGLNALDKILESNDIKRALNFNDLTIAKHQKKPMVIQSVEGGHFLEGKIERLQMAYSRGLRHLGLLHDNDASVPIGDIYTNLPKWGGLTSFGKEVIGECNSLGILIDLTHSSNDTINAALKTSTKPVVISHTGLDSQLGTNESMAKMMRPRLISKEQAKIVADAGGVIGVWTHLSETPEEYAQNIRAMVSVAGIDHVCIGTDTKITPSYRPQVTPTQGLANERIGERTKLAWKDQREGFLYTVVGAMLRTGFKEDEILKISGSNFGRVFKAATNVTK